MAHKVDIWDTGYRIDIALKVDVRDTKCRIQDTGYRIQNTGFKIQNTEYRIYIRNTCRY